MNTYIDVINEILKTINPQLSLDVKIADLQQFFTFQSKLEDEYRERTKGSPSREKMLARWEDSLNREFLLKTPLRRVYGENQSLIRDVYDLVISGQNPMLSKFRFWFIKSDNIEPINIDFESPCDSNNLKLFEDIRLIVENISKGVTLAFFIEKLKNDAMKTNVNYEQKDMPGQSIKIDWLGQNNQLYAVLRDLKRQNLIGNSYEELGLFIKLNVKKFEETSISTIIKALGKENELPKNKRVDLIELEKEK